MSNGCPWPKIRVVTPSYNQGKFIEEAIRSVLLQGYPNLEYVITDGGSTDNTLEIIQAYEPWLSHWVSEKDRGQAHAVNKGWASASGDILGWLNSDDVYAPEALFAVAEAWNEAGKPGLLYGDALSTNVFLRPHSKKSMKGYSLKTMLLGKSMPQPAVFISKDFFSKNGPLDETLHYALDFEFFLRAWLRPGAQSFCYVPKVLAYSRRYGETKCQTGGASHARENVSVLRRTWQDHMKRCHISRQWRKAFSVAIGRQSIRYLDSGNILEACKVLCEAFMWSPRVVKNMAKPLGYFVIEKLRHRPARWMVG
jgi:glycosyltransferase involved in cell wall biosynthesis